MNLESLIEILNNKINYLNNLRITLVNIGDIAEITRVDLEIEDIRAILVKLES
jgi:hypothetical protein